MSDLSEVVPGWWCMCKNLLRTVHAIPLAVILVGIALLGCAPSSPSSLPASPTPDETPKTATVEPLPSKVETASSLKVNVDQNSPDELMLSFEYYDANQQRVTFADLENTAVVEIDGKTIDGERIKVLSSQTIKAPIIYSSEDSIIIPIHLLNLEGVNKNNLTARVHIKGDEIYVFGETVFSLETVVPAPVSTPTPTPAATPEPTPTSVGGVLSGDVVWTTTESPYILTGNTLVPEGSKLIIEPGTQVNLDDSFIQVDGTLQVLGTSQQPVTISSPVNIGYPRIIFKANSTSWDENTQSGSIIRNAIIEGLSYGYGLILVESSSPKIIDSTLTNTNPSGTVISIPFGGSPQIIANRISGEFGIQFYGSGFPQIIDNRIERHNASQGINLSLTRGKKSHVKIEGNLIMGFKYGVIIQRVDDNHYVSIISNHITDNEIGVHTGVYDHTGTPPLSIKMNAIHNNHWNAQSGNFDADMTENWWGSIDSATIEGSLYDYYQDFQRGHIIYEPFLMELPEGVPLP